MNSFVHVDNDSTGRSCSSGEHHYSLHTDYPIDNCIMLITLIVLILGYLLDSVFCLTTDHEPAGYHSAMHQRPHGLEFWMHKFPANQHVCKNN